MLPLTRLRDEVTAWIGRVDLGRFQLKRWVLGVITYAIMLVILAVNVMPTTIDIKPGEVSKRDIEAPRSIVNKPRTETLQTEARKRAIKEASDDEANYEINQTIAINTEESVTSIYRLVAARREALQKASAGKPNSTDYKSTIPILRSEIKRDTGVDLLTRTISTLLTVDPYTLKQMEQASIQLSGESIRDSRINDKNLPQVRELVFRQIDNYAFNEPVTSALKDLVSGFIKPNLVLNFERVRRAEEDAVRKIDPVMVLKGQTIVRRGEVVSEEQGILLRDLGLQKKHANYAGLVGIGTLLLGLMSLVLIYLRLYNPNVFDRDESLALLATLFIANAILGKLISSLPYSGIGYIIPVPFIAMLVTVLIDARLALVFNIICAVIIGVLTDFELQTVIVALIGGMVGVYSLSQVHQRSALTRAGFFVGVSNFATVCALGLLSGSFPLSILAASGLGALNGIVSAILTIGSVPFMETFFGIASSIRLIELANPTQPLLKRLLVEAPGTYHHSIIVGNLAESAAEAIGADYILARVGAHYHDIGKLKRPYFFVENQFASENPHDKISPSLSTLIITSHVKDGVELAQEHRLPPAVIDFIWQHHGTSLVSYFYHRASEGGSNENVSEAQFRYAGPKPQTRETAIVMLADSIEAAVKSMSQPDLPKIEALIKKIIKERLADGQLDECDLTLRDIDRISSVFLTVFSGIFHTRVEYPELSQEGGQANG